eukprot:311640_1
MTSKTEYEQVSNPLVIGVDEELHIAMTDQIELQDGMQIELQVPMRYDEEETPPSKKNKSKYESYDINKTLEQYKLGPKFYDNLWDEIKDQRLYGSPSNWS